jgi:hypothetical protein
LNHSYIHIAKNNAKIAELVFRQQAIDTVAGIAVLRGRGLTEQPFTQLALRTFSNAGPITGRPA